MPKKSRNDLIRAAVGYYLKNKNYVGERFRKSDIVLLQNRREFMFETMQTGDLERSNNFTYSNHTITSGAAIVEHFGRFSQFVESQAEHVCQELRRFYAPMICHLYIDLLKAREHKSAIDFLKKFAHLVAPVETYDAAPSSIKINGCTTANDTLNETTCSMHIRFVNNVFENSESDPELGYFVNLLQTLSACTHIEEVENDMELAQFRASKYELHTNENAVNIMKAYLENRGHVLILNLLHSWIQVRDVDNEQTKWTDDSIYFGATLEEDVEDEPAVSKGIKIKTEQHSKSNIKRHANSSAALVQPTVEVKTEKLDASDQEDTKKWGAESTVHTYMETIRSVKEQLAKTQILFPRCIRIAEKDRGLTSAHLDSSECHMAAGFNSSVIQLWQLNQHICSGKNLYRQRLENTCRWELNNCIKEDADAVEDDIQTHACSNSTSEKQKQQFLEQKYVDNSFNEYGGVQLRGHNLGVTAVRFSAHYPLLYSVSKDSTLRSWHAENFNCAAIYRGHRYPIWCFDESPLGIYVATGSKDLTARLWSTDRQYPLITYTGHTQDVECIAFHPNGNYIATGSTDLSVRLWCTTSGKVMRVFTDCKQAVTNVSFSPDGKLLAAGGEESKVRIFDLAAGAQLTELKDHSSSVINLAWSNNGRQLATCCRDGSLRVWDTKRLMTSHDSSNSHSTSNFNASSSSSSSSSSPSRLIALNSNCQRLVNVFFGRNDTVCCIGC